MLNQQLSLTPSEKYGNLIVPPNNTHGNVIDLTSLFTSMQFVHAAQTTQYNESIQTDPLTEEVTYTPQGINRASQSIQQKKQLLPPPTPAECINSLEDIFAIQNYILNGHSRHKYRNHALFILGITTGLRIQDLLSLKIKDILEDDNRTFKPSINIKESKTGKITKSSYDSVLITEAARLAITQYFQSINWNINQNDYLFKSQKKVEKGVVRINKKGMKHIITHPGEQVVSASWARRLLEDAQKNLNLPYHMSTHTMRKTFSNLVLILPEYSNIKINTTGITLAQIASRHSNPIVTLRYLCKIKGAMIAIRNEISNILLRKSNIGDIDILKEEGEIVFGPKSN